MKPTSYKILKWFSSLVFLVIAFLSGVYLLRGVLITPRVISFLENTIASQVGLEIKIGKFEGTFFSNIKIEDVTTVGRSGEGPLKLLEVQRLKIGYHPIDLLNGLSAFLANASLEIESAAISIDFTDTGQSQHEDETSFSLMLPERLPKISIQNSTLTIKGPDYATGLEGFSLVVKNKNPAANIARLNVDKWWWRYPEVRDGAVDLEAEASYQNGHIRLTRLAAGKHSFIKLADIDLSDFPEDLAFQLQLRLAGGFLEAKGALQKDHLLLNLKGSDINAAVISELLAEHYPTFGGAVSLSGQLNLPLETPVGAAADVKFHLQNPGIDDVTVEHIKGKLLVGSGTFRVQELNVTTGANQVTVSQGNISISAFGGELRDLLDSLSAEWFLECTDIPLLLKLAGVEAENYEISVPKHRLALKGLLKNGVLMIPAGSFETESGYLRLKEAKITLPAVGHRITEASVKGDLDIDIPDLAFIGRIFELPSLNGSVQGNVKMAGTLSAPKGDADFKTSEVAFKGVKLGDANIELNMAGKHLTIKSAGFRNGNDRLLFSGSFRTDIREMADVKAEVDIRDLAAYMALWPEKIDTVSGAVQGSLQAEGDLFRPEANAELRIEKFHLNDIIVENGDIRLRNSGQLLNIEQIDIRSDKGQFKAAGTVRHNVAGRQFDITLSQAAIGIKAPLLELEKPSQIHVTGNGKIEVDDMVLKGSAGRISVGGKFLLQDSADILIITENVNSDNWFDLFAGDRIRFQGLNSRIRISGNANSPFFSVQGTLDELSSPDAPVPFSCRFHLEHHNQVLSVQELTIDGGKDQKVSVTGNLPFDPFGANPLAPGPIKLSGLVEITDARALDVLFQGIDITDGLIQSDFQIAGTWRRPEGGLHLKVQNLAFSGRTKLFPPGPYEIVGNLRIDGDRVILDGFAINSAVLKVRADGKWTGAPTLVDLYSATEIIPSGEIEMDAFLEAPDLSWVARGVEGIRRIAGRLEARGTVRGPVSSPNAGMVISLNGGSLILDSDVPNLESLNIETEVTTERVDIKSITGELGGSPFQLSGAVDLRNVSESATDLRLKGENLLLYRDENLRLRADMDLLLKGPLSRLSLTGGVAISDGRFTQNFGVLEGLASAGKTTTDTGFRLFSIKDPPLKDMVFNLKITAKKPFLIRNNLFRGAARPDLRLLGTGELPVLAGKIYLDPSRLYLPAGKMILESGLIRFDENDPDRPNIDLLGNTSMLGYDITAVVSGPYDEPVITLSSSPPLSNEELLMLLLTGQTPKNDRQRLSGGNSGTNAAVFLGRDMLSRLSDSESEDAGELILDRLDIEVGRFITRRGEETINAKFLLANDILLKGDSLYLTGEKDVFDYYNGGLRIVFRFR